MIMTDEEIARDYKQAKDGLRQAKILADQNLCTKEEIVKILLDQGVKVDGRLLQKGKRHASPGPKPKPAPAPDPKPEPQSQPQQKQPDVARVNVECIDTIATNAIMAAVQYLPGKEAYLVGQILNYVLCHRWKNGVADLNAARFYLDRLIEELGQ